MGNVFGWAGTILNIDLDAGKTENEPLPFDFARKYLGGSGFNSAKLFELVKPEIDALSPENVLMFGVGTLTGTLAPGSARLTITAKSPLTDIFGDSNIGGHWGTMLKFAGFDQLVFLGKAQQPVYLWIDGGKAELKDASHLWGKTTWETDRAIKEVIGDPAIKVACIGPGGENLVRFASIMCPTKRAAGRSGMGAVMGSKNLKAIAVRGGCDVNIAQPEAFLKACMEDRRDIIESQPHYEAYHAYGTPALLSSTAPAGVIAVRNYQRNTFENWEALSGETLKREFVKSMRACATCHVACGPFHNVQSGEFAGTFGEGPEYASAELGILMDCNNLAAELKYQELCNQFGIDIYSAGTGIAWAMECYERGILTDADFDGRPLRFGDYQSVIDIVPQIARRQGFGDILAEGEKRAPKLVGQGSEQFRYHVKGQSPVTEDPRAHKGFGLQNLTGTRGADHLKGNCLYMRHILRHTQINMDIGGEDLMMDLRCPDGVGRSVKWGEDMTATLNSVGMCTRTLGSIQILARLLCAATGVDFTDEELLVTGERIFNVQKAFNARQGLTRKDDNYSVPEKFTKEPIKDGPCKGMIFERDLMLDEYYQTREWDVETGLQTKKQLSKLGLEHIAEDLEKVNAIKQREGLA